MPISDGSLFWIDRWSCSEHIVSSTSRTEGMVHFETTVCVPNVIDDDWFDRQHFECGAQMLGRHGCLGDER